MVRRGSSMLNIQDITKSIDNIIYDTIRLYQT